jgi:hypothetical protein
VRSILRALATGNYIPFALIVAILLLVLVTTTSSPTEAQNREGRPASSESQVDNVVSTDISAAERTDAKSYWTTERMRNAKPLDMTITKSPGSSITGAPPRPEGRPVKVPPTAPSGGSASGASATGIQPAGTPVHDGYAYPFPFTRYEVIDPGSTSYTAYPYSTNGKVFFTDPDRGNFVCSGTVVNTQRSPSDPGNRSTIWTAGHCVSDGQGQFHTNWVFVPAYRDNVRPHGTWTARILTTTGEWHSFGNFELDVGAAVLNTQSGVPIQNPVGAQGIIFNQAYNQHWHAFGYPAAPPFNGQRQWVCTASHAVSDDPSARTNVPTIGIGCDMTGGASGGGWILRWSFGGGFINSVNSYKYTTQPLAMYGPYHGNDALSVFNNARTR